VNSDRLLTASVCQRWFHTDDLILFSVALDGWLMDVSGLLRRFIVRRVLVVVQ